ncbi:Crp/Fnr family transcriptional regulator [Salinimicrobium terrae]|uniref:Crp/Fnr family transcriptional regulator n=1 Tax=Salinimicrobium terrae TaxID=470866 RepID=UPI000559DD27|nr:Crp/Fnr family transcriptional regulator [Salinimicrobium terrae]
MLSEKKRRKYTGILSSNKLLKDLCQDELQKLLDELEEVEWPKSTCSIYKQRTSNHFHFIISGRLKVYQINVNTGREFTFFLLKKNDAFDILCLLDGDDHDVYYETLDRVVLLSLPMERMKKWVRAHPEINKNLLPFLSNQMKTLEAYASNVTLIDISTRLARLILRNINAESQELELINDLSNEELANLIGSTRAVVNRHLQEFKNDGIISLRRKKVEIKDLDLLLSKANNNKDSAP